MNQVETLKISKNFILYLRLSLIIGIATGISISLCYFLYKDKPLLVDVVHLLLLLFAVPGYLILPGIIYKPFIRDKKLPLVPIEQILFFAITVISLGIIPSWIYFKKFDPQLKALMKGKYKN